MVRLETVRSIRDLLDIDPLIDPEFFWSDKCNVDLEAIKDYARFIQRTQGIPASAVMAMMEDGATIAIRDKLGYDSE